MWTIRNRMIHGTGGALSQVEKNRLNNLALVLYRQRIHLEGGTSNKLFPSSEAEVEKMSTNTKKAWIEQLKLLYAEKYNNVVSTLKKQRLGEG